MIRLHPIRIIFSCLVICSVRISLHAQLSKEDFLSEARRADELLHVDPEASFRLADSLYQLAEQESWLQGVIQAQTIIAQSYRVRGEYDIARSNYEKLNTLIEDNYDDLSQDYINHTTQQHIASYYNIASIHNSQGEYDSTLLNISISDSLNERGKGIVKDKTYQANKINVKSLQGVVFYSLGRLEEAAALFEQSAELYRQLGQWANVAIAYNNLGLVYQNTGDLNKAIKYIQQALDIADSANYGTIKAAATGRLGQQFYSMKYYDQALSYSKKSYESSQKHGLKFEMANQASYIADSYKALGRVDSAQSFYEISLELHTELDTKDWVAYILERIAGLKVENGDCQGALSYINQGLQIAEENDYPQERLLLKVLLAECLLKEGETRELRKIVDELLVMASVTDFVSHQRDVYRIAHQAANASGDNSKAYEYLIRFNQLKDSIYTEEKSLEIATANYEYELEKETRRLEVEQERQRLIFEEQQARNRLINISLAVVSSLVALIAFLAYRAYRIKQKSNEDLAEKNNKLEELRATEKKLSEETLAAKERELATMAMATHEKNVVLKNLEQTVSMVESRMDDQLKSSFKEMKKTIEDSYALDKSWDSFLHRFNDVHPQFFEKLKQDHPKLTMDDLKLSAYLKIGMSNKEIANVTHLAPGSVKSKINRLKKKLKLGPDDNIRDMMMI